MADFRQARSRISGMLDTARARRPYSQGLADQRVGLKSWLLPTGDIRRLDPHLQQRRQELAQGRYRPGVDWQQYAQPTGWGWGNPLGVRQWFSDPGERKTQTIDRIKQTKTWQELMSDFRRGHLSMDELKAMSPTFDLGQMYRPEELEEAKRTAGVFTRERRLRAGFRRLMAQRLRGRQEAEQAAEDARYTWAPAGRAAAQAQAAAQAEAQPEKTGHEKLAILGWFRDRMNRQFDARLENALESPEAARPFFDQVRQGLEGDGPGFLERLNPLNWGRLAYTQSRAGREHMKSQMAKRLSADDTQMRLFPNRSRSTAGALTRIVGPMGAAGLGGLGAGLAMGDPLTALAGGALTAVQGARQYQRVTDPMTWARAFGSRRPGEEQQSDSDLDFLNDISTLTGPTKTGSEKTASPLGSLIRLARKAGPESVFGKALAKARSAQPELFDQHQRLVGWLAERGRAGKSTDQQLAAVAARLRRRGKSLETGGYGLPGMGEYMAKTDELVEQLSKEFPEFAATIGRRDAGKLVPDDLPGLDHAWQRALYSYKSLLRAWGIDGVPGPPQDVVDKLVAHNPRNADVLSRVVSRNDEISKMKGKANWIINQELAPDDEYLADYAIGLNALARQRLAQLRQLVGDLDFPEGVSSGDLGLSLRGNIQQRKHEARMEALNAVRGRIAAVQEAQGASGAVSNVVGPAQLKGTYPYLPGTPHDPSRYAYKATSKLPSAYGAEEDLWSSGHPEVALGYINHLRGIGGGRLFRFDLPPNKSRLWQPHVGHPVDGVSKELDRISPDDIHTNTHRYGRRSLDRSPVYETVNAAGEMREWPMTEIPLDVVRSFDERGKGFIGVGSGLHGLARLAGVRPSLRRYVPLGADREVRLLTPLDVSPRPGTTITDAMLQPREGTNYTGRFAGPTKTGSDKQAFSSFDAGPVQDDRPYRERVEVYALEDGKVYGGTYQDGTFSGFGGGVDDDDQVSAAAREFAEESGYKVINLQKLDVPAVKTEWREPYPSQKVRDRAKTYRGQRTTFYVGDLDRSGEQDKAEGDDGKSGLQAVRLYTPEGALRTFKGTQQEVANPEIGKLRRARKAVLREIQARLEAEKLEKEGSFDPGAFPYDTDPQDETNERANEFLDSHFSISRGRQAVLDSTNVRPHDKLKMLNALDRGARRENTGERGLLTYRSALSSLVGAGMGFLGASLAAPVLGTSPKQKNRLRIGGSALGAVLNNPWLTRNL